MSTEDALDEIIESLLRKRSLSGDDVNRVKMRAAAKYHLERIPSNSEVIGKLNTTERKQLLPILRRKNTRSISGVTVIAVMTKPHSCPQPQPCAYCPGGIQQGVPQSYTGFEPAAMRGLQNDFDPYRQVKSRIEQLQAIGHDVDKVELIVMGGTFPSTPIEYQTWFIQRCLDAITNKTSSILEEAKKNAETSMIRNVGITVETRPDWAKEKHVDIMLDMGVTRVELGVQNPDNRIYHLVNRTHTVKDVVDSTRIMKDAGLKIVYHLMPGMPGSNPTKDLAAFKKIFNDPRFKPDMIKVYPCLVIKDTRTYSWYKQGTYKPYSDEDAVNLLAEVKKNIPPWVRVMRVQRDIPAPLIVAGVKKSNLRQTVHQKLKDQGLRCRCIRCREIGHRALTDNVRVNPDRLKLLTIQYEASEGTEHFISIEDSENDVLVGYLRLRMPSEKAHRPEIKTEAGLIIRELHIYGRLVPVGKHLNVAWQHKGYGGILLEEAERLSRERYSLKKILVISGLGTKEYYKRFGYDYDGVYMSKKLGEQG